MANEKWLVRTVLFGAVCSLCTGRPMKLAEVNLAKGPAIKKCSAEDCLIARCGKEWTILSVLSRGCVCPPCGPQTPSNPYTQIQPHTNPHSNTNPDAFPLHNTHSHTQLGAETSYPKSQRRPGHRADSLTGRSKGRRYRRSIGPTPSPGYRPIYPPQVGTHQVEVVQVPVEPEYPEFIVDPVPILPVI